MSEAEMNEAYKYRIHPTQEQENLIQHTFGCTRFVCNRFLAECIDAYKATRKYPSRVEKDTSLAALKSAEGYEWLQEVDSTALQYSVECQDTEVANFFCDLHSGQQTEYPKFKCKRDRNRNYRSKQVDANTKMTGGAVDLPKLGRVPCAVSRQVKGHITSTTVPQNSAGEYHVIIQCEANCPALLSDTDSAVGVDLGAKDLAVTVSERGYVDS